MAATATRLVVQTRLIRQPRHVSTGVVVLSAATEYVTALALWHGRHGRSNVRRATNHAINKRARAMSPQWLHGTSRWHNAPRQKVMSVVVSSSQSCRRAGANGRSPFARCYAIRSAIQNWQVAANKFTAAWLSAGASFAIPFSQVILPNYNENGWRAGMYMSYHKVVVFQNTGITSGTAVQLVA